MLQLPPDYIHALEEVLNTSLSPNFLKTREGKQFIQKMSREVSRITFGLRDEHAAFVESKYLKEEMIRQAYLLYYATIGHLKIWPSLRELAQGGFFNGRETITHLDLGSGPGTAVWGLATYLTHEQPHVTLNTLSTDALAENLRLVERFANHLKVPVATSQLDLTSLSISAVIPRTSSLITLMNVLAEIDEKHDAAIIDFLHAHLEENGAIISIEPSRKTESRRALRFRDRMVDAGFFVFAPCCRMGHCPALENHDNWCHTEIR